MQRWVGDFYQRVPSEDQYSFGQGQFYWAPIPYLPPCDPLHILDIKDYDPRDETRITLTIVPATRNAFRDRHVPIKALEWETDEEIIPLRAKKRPVVVISQEQHDVAAVRTPDDLVTYLVAPVYSITAEHDPAFVARVKHLEYNQFFYLAEDSHFNRREAFARLDRIQPAHKRLMEPIPVRLSDSAWMLFKGWVSYYLTGELDELIADIRSELLKEFYT